MDNGFLKKMTELDNENASEFGKYLLGLSYGNIGGDVRVHGKIGDELLTDVISFCRRRVKKNDILLVSILDSEEEGTEGLAFTSDRIIWWEDEGETIREILYKEITGVDFDEEDLILKVGNEIINIYLGEDAEEEKYSRYMYHFVMDILEYNPDQSVEPEISEQNHSSEDALSGIKDNISMMIDGYEQGKASAEETLNSLRNILISGIKENKKADEMILDILKEAVK